jgi:hypothetical protein
MDNIKNLMDNHKCNICNKIYSSYKSLWNHNKEFHKVVASKRRIPTLYVPQPTPHVPQNASKVHQPDSKLTQHACNSCNKIFNRKDNLKRHEKTCKIKENDDNEIENLKNTINEMKEQIATILQEKGKVHHKTLQKINNQLTNNINNQLTNNGQINNGKIINNTYVKFGDVDYQRILDNKQVKHILNQQFMSIEESIKLVHFNKDLPEYNNVFITNMRDDIGYIFNGKEFISVKKNEMINELIDSHIKEINLSLEKHKNKLNEKYVTRLEKFLDMLNDDDTKFTDQNNQRTFPSYKAYKMNSIKLLIYNSSDKKKLDEIQRIELQEKIYDIDDSDDDINYKINDDNELII